GDVGRAHDESSEIGVRRPHRDLRRLNHQKLPTSVAPAPPGAMKGSAMAVCAGLFAEPARAIPTIAVPIAIPPAPPRPRKSAKSRFLRALSAAYSYPVSQYVPTGIAWQLFRN